MNENHTIFFLIVRSDVIKCENDKFLCLNGLKIKIKFVIIKRCACWRAKPVPRHLPSPDHKFTCELVTLG